MPMAQISLAVDTKTELRLVDDRYSEELFRLVDSNRAHLRRWHPWIDTLRSVSNVEKTISTWQGRFSSGQACYYGVWFEDRLCGMINYISVDLSNQWAALSYWLDAEHQGKGIMTNCCLTMISQAFHVWKFNRVSIECATENTRSRAIPERLGFKLEGILCEVEWLHDRYVDHAIYGLLRSNDANGKLNPADSQSINLPWSDRTGSAESALLM
jgi:ribosomal-protein-serine acetyltransferase